MARSMKWLVTAMHKHFRTLPVKTLARAMKKNLSSDDKCASDKRLRQIVSRSFGVRGTKATAIIRAVRRSCKRR